MKALCLSLGDEAPLKGGWLTVHQEYVVFGILAVPSRSIYLRVLSDDGRTPILADSSLFKVTDQPLPPAWVCSVTQDGVVELGPSEWLKAGFWERFFDGDPEAVQSFRKAIDAFDV